MQVTNTEILQFAEYVASFYDPSYKGVLYPIRGANNAAIFSAINSYFQDQVSVNPDKWGGGDSVDRENVRDILTDQLGAGDD
jgi:hypothetical protein